MARAEEAARQAVVAYLKTRPPIPDGIRDKLVLGKGHDGNHWVFELYVPGPRPEDAIVLVEARVAMADGAVSVDSPRGTCWDLE